MSGMEVGVIKICALMIFRLGRIKLLTLYFVSDVIGCDGISWEKECCLSAGHLCTQVSCTLRGQLRNGGTKVFSITSPNSAELSNAAGWESDQFGTSTSPGLEKSRPGPFSSCGERSFRAQVAKNSS